MNNLSGQDQIDVEKYLPKKAKTKFVCSTIKNNKLLTSFFQLWLIVDYFQDFAICRIGEHMQCN